MHKSTFRALLLCALFMPGAAFAGNPLLPDALQSEPATKDAPAVEVKANPVSAGLTLIPFAEPSDRFRLIGEADNAILSFSVSEQEARAGGKLQLAYKNAVSVLPDDARLSVEINGKSAGEFPIASPFDFQKQEIAVGPDALRPGRNMVRVSVIQHHRVDCSLDATYELWTQLSPALSGFRPANAQVPSSLERLSAVGRLESGATDLRLVLADGDQRQQINEAMPALQTLVLALGREDLKVTVASTAGKGPGIDLLVSVGRGAPASSVAPERGIHVQPMDANGRLRVTVNANGSDDLASLMLAAVKGPLSESLKDNLTRRNGQGIIHAEPDHDHPLSEAGIRSATFAGRLLRTHFDLAMPADFYPADYATIDLKLSAATAPGLDPASKLLVRVNDKVVNAFPFRNTDGQSFDAKLIKLPLRAFRPGMNSVELLAELPNARDKACAPGERDDSKPRYVLLNDTSLSVPKLARVARFPDLAALAGSASPFSAARPLTIRVDADDPRFTGPALTLLSRLALAEGAPLKAAIEIGGSSQDASADSLVLTVADRQSAAASPAAHLALFDQQTTDPVVTASIADGNPNGDELQDQLMQAFEQSSADAGERSFSTRFKGFLASMSERFGNWLSYEDDMSALQLTSDAVLTLAQTKARNGGASATIIRVASAEDLVTGVNRLTDPDVWARLEGGAAILREKNLSLVNLAVAHPQIVAVTDHSAGNYRRIAAAWLSDNFQVYVVAVILLVGFFAVWLGRLVPRLGTRTVK
ncbi:cellulose biosynthesis cyclic di-GMP-binding regulatory protein BcsB [Rhizobium alvei]|uniref:Cyclic di-GMP-binding protein n=1 Tax=Rhizobium alvei TaxID=1132659 RepID=A0ABT8YN12_9HYPH|nr:cellulose biosynthesis cyclic di-GMP-binding regulatory protein BcsB [Rhizobium alvei]MDO6965113.1 cellulose biosynthesis cyclic di-GMP-binding regulatory protein BcsB [Rhizobium alvei]